MANQHHERDSKRDKVRLQEVTKLMLVSEDERLFLENLVKTNRFGVIYYDCPKRARHRLAHVLDLAGKKIPKYFRHTAEGTRGGTTRRMSVSATLTLPDLGGWDRFPLTEHGQKIYRQIKDEYNIRYIIIQHVPYLFSLIKLGFPSTYPGDPKGNLNIFEDSNS